MSEMNILESSECSGGGVGGGGGGERLIQGVGEGMRGIEQTAEAAARQGLLVS